MKKGNKLDKKFNKISAKILDKGVKKDDRTGTGTISLFDTKISHNMKNGFPILTGKKMFMKGASEELIWFLRGETNIRPLVINGVNIWVGDAYKYYEKYALYSSDPNDTNLLSSGPIFTKKEFVEKIKTDERFASKWGELGPIYGSQWRKWRQFYTDNYGGTFSSGLVEDTPIDQILNLIHELKNNPDSRRLMVSAWNVADIGKMKLPPCHYGFQCYTRDLTPEERATWILQNWYETGMEYDIILDNIRKNPEKTTYYGETEPIKAISLKWNQRSADFPLGVPFNITSYGLLLHILGKIVNMVPDKLSGTFGDSHIYLNQVDGMIEQISRENIHRLPQLELLGEFNKINDYWENGEFKLDLFLSKITSDDFKLHNYTSHPPIKFPLSN